MNARAYLLLSAVLCVFAGGCATPDGVPVRVIEVSAAQTETEPSGPAGLSAAVATNLFYDVTGRLGRSPANAPQQDYPDPKRPKWIEYAAQFTPEGGQTIDLTLDMDGKQITFRGITGLDDPKSIAALQTVMKLYEESLDERHIRYKVGTFKTELVTIPS